MDKAEQERLWRELDAVRDRGHHDVSDLIKIAAKANVALDFETLENIYARHPRFAYDGNFICPLAIREFITGYLKALKMESVLDPWADSLLLISLAQSAKAQRVIGFVRWPGAIELAATLQGASGISWQAGDFLNVTLADDEQFDAVVSCAPFGQRRSAMSFETSDKTMTIRDNEASLTVLKASRHLSPDGVGLFVVPNNFFHGNDTGRMSELLSHSGLHVDAAIAVPAGILQPVMSAFATLIVVRHGSADRMFVGQLSGNRERDDVLLQNLLGRRRGREPALGAIIARSEYHGFEAIAARFRVKELARNRGIAPRRLADIAVKFSLRWETEALAREEQAHAIYLPLLGLGPVLSSPTQAMLRRPSNYVRVVLNPADAVPEYVAQYFNTALGKEARSQANIGSSIQRISVRLLETAPVYLPDRETQLQTIETTTQIENLLSTLEALRERAWSQPRKLKDVVHELQTVNKEDTFTGWIDTLPFPLASILWTYHTIGSDYQRRYERLLQFFEAQAEFLSAILIAGFEQDTEWLTRKKFELQSILAEQSLDKGTFGVWIRIAENLAKEARTYLNASEDAQERCFTLFKSTDRDVLAMLFSSEIISVLQQANDLRNSWAGHTGVVSPTEAHERHTVLESLLAKVRRIYSTQWQNYRLVKAGTTAFENGVYRYQVEVIMGTRTPFEPAEILTDQPMEYKCLYLLPAGGRQPLKLVPLIQVMPSPKTAANACYFYNRTEGNKLRFVSYHFEQDAEIVESFPDVVQALRAITGNGE